ncbi:MAG: hypothetical protein IT326_08825, partial [Anaerolineae bacterium]|nr:hypothetical protein [Anaerolineae bacterium]
MIIEHKRFFHQLRYRLPGLLLACAVLLLFRDPATAQSGEAGFELADSLGGMVMAAVPQPDGSVIFAEGSALIAARLGSGAPILLNRTPLPYGAILDIRPTAAGLLLLTESGVYHTTSDGLTVLGTVPGSGRAFALRNDLIAVAAQEAGIRLIALAADGGMQPLSTIDTRAPALSVTFDPILPRLYIGAGETGVYRADISNPALPGPAVLHSGSAFADTVVATTNDSIVVAGAGAVSLAGAATGSVLGRFDALADAQDVIVRDEVLYVADGRDGLKIFWLAAPDRPLQTAGERGSPAVSLALEADNAVIVGPDGLRILDIRDRYAPVELGRIALPGEPQGVALAADGRAFVALGSGGIALVDLTNRTAPRLLRRIPVDTPVSAVSYQDGWLYGTAGDGGLVTIDARMPGAETFTSLLALACPAQDIAGRRRVLFIACGESGLLAIDTTQPNTPLISGILPAEPGISFNAITLADKRAYISTDSGFLVADVSRPASMGKLADNTGESQAIGAAGKMLYTVSGGEITIYDIRATAEPLRLRLYSGVQHPARLTVSGNLLLMANAADGPDLVILNIADPARIHEVENIGETGQTKGAVVTGKGVWLARGGRGLQQFDMTEAGGLLPQGEYRLVSPITYLARSGDRLVAGGSSGWLVLTPEEGQLGMPAAASTVQTTSGPLALDGTTLVSTDEMQNIALYDISTAPAQLLALTPAHGPVRGIALDADHVYAADSLGLSIFSRPLLVPLAQVNTPSVPTGLALHDRLAYLPLEDGGLAVVDLTLPGGGLERIHDLRLSRPVQFLPADDDSIYVLSASSLSLITLDRNDQLVILRQAQVEPPPERGLLLGEFLAAYSDDGLLRLYDPRHLDPTAIPRGQIALTESNGPQIHDLQATRSWLYAAFGPDGLGTAQIGQPGAPRLTNAGTVNALLTTGDTLFTAGDRLIAWSLTDASTPAPSSELNLPGAAYHLALSSTGNLIVSGESGLGIYRQEGDMLVEVATMLTSSPALQTIAIGERMYTALGSGGLLVSDLSTPEAPTPLFIYTSPLGRFVADMFLWPNGRLFVAWENGVELLDTTSSGAGETASTAGPRLLNVIPLADGPVRGVTISENGVLASAALGDEG